MVNNKRKLYDALSGEYDLGTYEEFEVSIADEEKRRKLYDAAIGDYDLGTYEEYSARINEGAAQPQARVDLSDLESQNTVAEQTVVPEAKPMVSEEPESISPENAQKLRGLWANMKESTKGIGAGIKGLAGETLNLATGSSREEAAVLGDIEQLEAMGIDPLAYLQQQEGKEFQRLYGMTKDEFLALSEKERKQLVRKVANERMEGQPFMNPRQLNQLERENENQQKVRDAFNKALEAAGGDMDKAKAILKEEAANGTLGDQWISDALETQQSLRQPEGFAGWVGNLIPQMVPSAAALALGYFTKGKAPGLSKLVGYGTMGTLTASTAGMSMLEAREAGATNLEVWTTGLADGAIEIITEKLPFDRFTNRVFAAAKAKLGNKLSEAVLTPRGRKELEKLLSEANARLGGKLFTKSNVGDWLLDTAYEAGGEFTAEALQTVTSMIYENPEDYPTISEVLSAGWEGAKAGLFMGAILGGASKAAEHSMNKSRRQQQGFIDVAQIENENGEVEVVEVVGQDPAGSSVLVLRNGEIEQVETGKIGDTFRFSYEEFEKGRLQNLEDEAIADEAVSRGQVDGMKQTLEQQLAELNSMLPEGQEYTLEELTENDNVKFDSPELQQAVEALRDSKKRADELENAYNDQYKKRHEAKRGEIEKAVGQQFWYDEEVEYDPATDTYSLGGTYVEEVQYADGRVGYVVGSDVDGNLTMVYTDGTKGFATRAEIEGKKASGEIVSDTTMYLDEYVDSKVEQDDLAAEQNRMSNEEASNIEKAKAAHPVGSVINVGTKESPIEAPILSVSKDGVIVRLPDGTTPMLTWEDVAHAEGQELKANTDAQNDQAIVNQYRVAYAPVQRKESTASAQELEEEVERETPTKELPRKADGSVDQTALWNTDPVGWAEWNDEQRQDGGANSLNYINGAIVKEQAALAELQAAYDAESDFDARDAMEKDMNQKKARLEQLLSLQSKYLAAQQAEVQAANAPAQKTAAPAAPQQMSEAQKAQMDAQHQARLNSAKSTAAKREAMQAYINEISNGSVPMTLISLDEYEKVMKDAGCTPNQIAQVRFALEEAKNNGESVPAFFVPRVGIFAFIENIPNIEQLRLTYVHERQHRFTGADKKYLNAILQLNLGQTRLAEIVAVLSDSHFYDQFDEATLADEVISYAMERAYTYEDFSVALQKLGVEQEIIDIITEIDNEQRSDNTTYSSRRRGRYDLHDYSSEQGNRAENDRNPEAISGGLLGSQRNRPIPSSRRGAESREGAEVNPAFIEAISTDEQDAEFSQLLDDKAFETPKAEDGFESDDVRFSMVKEPEMRQNTQSYFDKHYKGGKLSASDKKRVPLNIAHFTQELLDAANAQIQELWEHMSPYLDMESKGKRFLPAEVYGKSTLFDNASYGKTMENTLICTRTLAYIDFVEEVKKRIGRPLTATESFLASQMLYDIAIDPQCLYCYVSLDRKAYDEFLLRYAQQRDEVIAKWNETDKTAEAKEALYKEFLNGRKPTPQMQARFESWLLLADEGSSITLEDLATKARRGELKIGEVPEAWVKASEKYKKLKGDKKLAYAASEEYQSALWSYLASPVGQVTDAEAYAQSASWAKKEEDYRSYTGELLKCSADALKGLMGHYGLRFYSFSEYSPAFILENMQMVRDAAARGLKGFAYTKEVDFIKIFAPTGMNINCSVYGRVDSEGNVVPDTKQGADWAEVQALREQYPNVGAVFVATNDSMVEWALNQPWIDVIIPFHIVRTGADIAKFYDWTNYSSMQADVTAEGKSKYIFPHEHHNDKETFLALAAERGYKPRFADVKLSDGRSIVEHPNYMRLVNETRRSVDETPILTPTFNTEAAKKSFDAFVEKGGYYAGYFYEDEAFEQGIETVVEDIKAGKTAKDVDYGRQDVPIDVAKIMSKRAEAERKHGKSMSIMEEAERVAADQVMMRIIGEQAAQRLDNARKANVMMDSLGIAKSMETAGKEAKAIKLATGWERGADGKWRYEMPDLEIKAKHGIRKKFQLKNLISDNTLFTEYPILKDATVIYEKLSDKERGYVIYVNDKPEIHITIDAYKQQNPVIAKGIEDFAENYPEIAEAVVLTGDLSGLTPEQRTIFMDELAPLFKNNPQFTDKVGGRNILVHEIQHVIQYEEGFATGGNDQMLDTTNPAVRAMVDHFTKEVEAAEARMQTLRGEARVVAREAADARRNGDKAAEAQAYARARQMNDEYNRLQKRIAYLENRLNGVRRLGDNGYVRLAGEVEARNAVGRINLSEEARLNSLLSETEDVARKDQIFLLNNVMMNADEYQASQGVSFRISPEQDKAYMDAVEKGDMETAQKMVDAAARAAGYDSPKLYHGTQGFGFTKIDTRKSDDRISFFATESPAIARSYSSVDGERQISDAPSKEEIKKAAQEWGEAAEESLLEYAQRLYTRLSQDQEIDADEFMLDFTDRVYSIEAKVEAGELSLGGAVYDIYEVFDAILNKYYNKQKYDSIQKFLDEKPAVWEERVDVARAYFDYFNKLINGGSYGNYALYASTWGMLEVDCKGSNWNDIKSRDLPDKDYSTTIMGKPWKTRGVARYAKEEGYKGVIFKNIVDPGGRASVAPADRVATIYDFFEPQQQVKSADPVTYDNEGKVIPLSERFNPDNPDIRFRVLDTTKAELKDKPIKLNGIRRFKLKSAFKGVKGAEGYYPYTTVQIEEVEDDFTGHRMVFESINEGYVVIYAPKGTVEMEDNHLYADPKKIETELWDALKSAENYFEAKLGGGPWAKFEDGYRDWVNVGSDDVRFSIIGERGAQNDKTQEGLERLNNLEVARQMESQLNPDWSAKNDENALKIKVATGWERGADGKWRYEVEDLAMRPESEWMDSKKKLALRDIVEPNPIFDMYPDLLDIKIVKDRSKYSLGAWYNHKKNEMKLPFGALKDDADFARDFGFSPRENHSFLRTLKKMETNILHEVQHAIQDREGFAQGGNSNMLMPEDKAKYIALVKEYNALAEEYNAILEKEGYSQAAKEKSAEADRKSAEADRYLKNHRIGESGYKRLSGEVEANNVEKRHEMSLNERRNSLLAATEDVARKDQIFIMEAVAEEQSSVRFRIANENQAIFVSNAAKAVEGIKMEKATPEQWLKMIEKNGGLKAGEDKWMGLSDWLKASDKKTLTKDEVMQFVNENMIRIEEQHYADFDADEVGDAMADNIQAKYGKQFADDFYKAFAFEEDSFYNKWYIAIFDEDLALKLYNEANNASITVGEYGLEIDDADTIKEWATSIAKEAEEVKGVREINSMRKGYTTRSLVNLREIALTVPTIEPWNVNDNTHFGDAGEGRAVAWIRFGETKWQSPEVKERIAEFDVVMKEMMDKYGYDYESSLTGDDLVRHNTAKRNYFETLKQHPSKKVLVIDEIQSKRHQEGREKGYKTKDYWPLRMAYLEKKTAYESLYDEMANKYGEEFTDAPNEEFAKRVLDAEDYKHIMQAKTEFDAASDAYIPIRNGVPEAPFEKNWHELAMKRMLRYAAENGYDVIAWTKGEQQAERYSLAKSVQGIEAWDRKPSSKIVRIKPQIGGDMLLEVDSEGKIVDAPHYTDYMGKQLSELVGKELAVALMQPGDVNIEEDGLTIGGEGMRGFYDKMLPSFMNKYGKKWGVKVEDIDLPNLGKDGLTMHSVPVTEEMKESVMEGQVMFRTSSDLDAEFGTAWRDQQNEDGRHSTQVANTKSTYEKIGNWMKDAGLEGAAILDASSGLGLGTQALREMGFQVDDVEPFPSENREAPTFASYDAIDGRYDVVISNAVLNVIPDDWRADVLHKMAAVVKDGGKIIINTRPASNIASQGVEGKTRITLDSPSEILVKRGDRIAAYQKGFTSEELAEWIKSELGEGWKVEKATKKNSGISGEGTAVVIKEGEPLYRGGKPTEEVVAEGVELSATDLAMLAGNIYSALPESVRNEAVEDAFRKGIESMQDVILDIPTKLAVKEDWNEQDHATADAVAEQVTKAAGKDMTRPFSAREALWVLYDATHPSVDIMSEASRVLVKRNLGFGPETLKLEQQAKDDVRFRTVGNASVNARTSLYNSGATNMWNRLKEVYVDMNATVESLVKAIEKASGKAAKGFENILLALNQQSSRGLAAMEAYSSKFLEPMLKEIANIMKKTGMKYDDVVRYVILKHGLERNIKLAQRDARNYYQEIYDEILAKVKGMNDAQKRTYLTNAQLKDADAKAELARLQAIDQSAMTAEQQNDLNREVARAEAAAAEAAEQLVRARKIATMTEAEVQAELDEIFDAIQNRGDSKYKELRENDYSGISSMFYDQLNVNRKDYKTEEEYQAALMKAKKDKFASLADVEAAAEAEVEDFENKTSTSKLWKTINAATKETLRQQYEANMISKDQYENLRDMFEYYVPLRGFADNTAEDMYTYYRKPNTSGYTKPILGAEGRKTEAESPFGWIAAMAGSAIASNVKNEAKLALYYFVSNRPNNGIATVSKTWYAHTPGDVTAEGKKIFKPVYPQFEEGLSSEEARQKYEQWQEMMNELREQGLAYESGQRLNLGNSVVSIDEKNKPEHIVNVKVGGKDYSIIINGNPRAAQAINGDLNIETDTGYSKLFGPVLRWMSSVNTSYNPEFWVTNMMRDMAFTLQAVTVKEDSEYQKKFAKNYAKAFGVIKMVYKNENGKLGDSYLEEMYKDFVANGGVTGYTQIKDSETWEREIESYMKSNNAEDVLVGNVGQKMLNLFGNLHRFGESLEQVSRFAAFLTSREMGKPMSEAISDAKEITVNFNRKGSGKIITLEEAKKLTNSKGQPLNKVEQWFVVGLSSIAPLGRRFVMFFNAAIQGLNAKLQLWKKSPAKTLAWNVAYFAIGVMNALLHSWFDDDDDYLDMPQYERTNSFMFGWNGTYFKWALPQESRVYYALGDLAVETILGRNPHQNAMWEAAKVAGEVLPMNPLGGWKEFVPSALVPAVELLMNEDYKGSPIYNEQKWLSEEERKRTAKWSAAYQNTGKLYVDVAKMMNNITGGDEFDAGWINLQPEAMEHIVQSAFGGTVRTADKAVTTFLAAVDPDEKMTIRQAPFLNRIVTINSERFRNAHVNDVYNYYAAEAEHVLALQKKYEADGNLEKYKELSKSEEYGWAKIYSKYKEAIDNYNERIKVAKGMAEKMELMKEQDELKRRVIKEISEL